jgi:biotin transport system substrate-specific component
MSVAVSARPTLAGALWPAQGSLLRSILLVAAGVCLLTLSAKIKVPFGAVPMTLQTLVVVLIGAAYGWRLGMTTVLAYLATGMAGMPVFANTPPALPSPAYFLGPTGGYLIGYVFAAGLVGFAAERGFDRSPVKLFAAMLMADAIIFACGVVWLGLFATLASGATGLGLETAWMLGAAPFLIGDLVKMALGACLVPALWVAIQRLRGH